MVYCKDFLELFGIIITNTQSRDIYINYLREKNKPTRPNLKNKPSKESLLYYKSSPTTCNCPDFKYFCICSHTLEFTK